MRIYHYTSVEVLALILKNKTIRFSRLDRVDDPYEYGFIKDGHNPAKFTYISCWTKNSIESIPQWIIYGNQRHGVRISFESDNLFDIKNEGVYNRWFTNEEMKKMDVVIPPILDNDILYDIQYVDNPKSYTANIFPLVNGENAIDFKEIGRYKTKDWSFQDECRYKIHAFPKNIKGSSIPLLLANLIKNDIYPHEEFIDIPLKETALDDIEILLGPDSSQAEHIIVEALCNQYIKKDCIKASALRP